LVELSSLSEALQRKEQKLCAKHLKKSEKKVVLKAALKVVLKVVLKELTSLPSLWQICLPREEQTMLNASHQMPITETNYYRNFNSPDFSFPFLIPAAPCRGVFFFPFS